MFKTLGVQDVFWFPLHDGAHEAAFDPALVAKVKDLNVIFFGGGSQNRLIGALRTSEGETPLLREIKRLYDEKLLIIAGDSAGAAAQARGPAITSGDSYEALTRPSQPTTEIYNGWDLSYNPEGGLGFFPFAVDTHFAERGREGRLVRFAAETGQPLAFGVDEGTALVLTNPHEPGKRTASIEGKGGVTIFDLNRAKVSDAGGFQVEGVGVSFLTSGDTYLPDLRRSVIREPNTDSSKRPTSQAKLRSFQEDIFGAPRVSEVASADPAVVAAQRDSSRSEARAFNKLALSLGSSAADGIDAVAWESARPGQPVVKVELRKGADWLVGHQGASFDGLTLNIHTRGTSESTGSA